MRNYLVACLALLILLLPSAFICAQFPLYDRADYPRFMCSFTAAVHDGNNAFTAAGVATQYSTTSWPLTYPIVQHFDSAGQLAWTYTSAAPYHESVNLTSFLRLSTGEYLLSWSLNGCDYFEGLGRIELLDENGLVLWGRQWNPAHGPIDYYFSASTQLSSGNFLFATDNFGAVAETGFFKIRPTGDSVFYQIWPQLPHVKDMESIAGDRLLIGDGSRAVISDTSGNVQQLVNVSGEVVDADALTGGGFSILTESTFYLADANLTLTDSVNISWFGGNDPLEVFEENGEFWIASAIAAVKLDASLDFVSQTDFPSPDPLAVKAVARGAGGFFTAGEGHARVQWPMNIHSSNYTAVRTVADDGSFDISEKNLRVDNISISNYAYNNVTETVEMDVTVTVTNAGSSTVDDFYLSTPFGLGFGWICGGAMYQNLFTAQGLAPGQTQDYTFHWLDGQIPAASMANYPLNVFTACPDYRIDADATDDFLTVWLNNGVISRDGPALEVIHVFPQPLHDAFEVEITGFRGPGTLQVTDALGQVIWEQMIEEPRVTVDAGEWAAAVYVLSVEAGGRRLSRRIVKQ